MRDISDAADLMTTAREALLRDLLPALSGERRYAALMSSAEALRSTPRIAKGSLLTPAS